MSRPKLRSQNKHVRDLELGSGAASISEQAEFYDEFWDQWFERYRPLLAPFYYFDETSRWRAILRQMRLTCGTQGKGRLAFDLGCGRGRIAMALNRMNWSVSGIELSEKAVAETKALNPALDLHAGDMFAFTGYPEGRCDLVVSSEVMEHIPVERRYDYVTLFERLLAPDGIGIVTTPNLRAMKRLGYAAEQPLDYWMTLEELSACFEPRLSILNITTTCRHPRNTFLARSQKMLPLVNRLTDARAEQNGTGKYLILTVQRCV